MLREPRLHAWDVVTNKFFADAHKRLRLMGLDVYLN